MFMSTLRHEAQTQATGKVITSRASAVISDLTSGQQYTFRAVVIGANPARIYSDEISSFVLGWS